MQESTKTQNSKSLLGLSIVIQLFFCLTLLLQIDVAMQVIGFIYLSFIPGYVFVKLLNINSDKTKTVLYSLGISIAFTMFAGLCINEIGYLVGVTEPLSLIPLLIVLNIPVILSEILLIFRANTLRVFESDFPSFPLKISDLPHVLIIIALPLLSIIGTIYQSFSSNVTILLFTLLLVAGFFAYYVFSKNPSHQKLYPFIIYGFSISILYQSSLISNTIFPFGSDVSLEYLIAKTTDLNSHWSSLNPFPGDIVVGRVSSMLSVSVLPTAYSNLLNFDMVWVFKLIYPLLFAFVPMGLYYLWKGYIGEKYSFASSFFFISFSVFFNELLGLTRQIIAEIFLVLLLIVLFEKNIKAVNRVGLFLVFSFGLITSHYGLAEIFLLFMVSAFLISFILKRANSRITFDLLVIFSVLLFTWYIYTSGSAVFNSITDFSANIIRQLGDFFNPASRGGMVLAGLGFQNYSSIWNMIGSGFQYLTQGLIVVGILALLTKRAKNSFGKDFFYFILVAAALLAALIIVPGLANAMNMSRFYHFLLFFLAPVCVVGLVFLSQKVMKKHQKFLASLLVVLVFVPYFLFQTGVIYEVTQTDSWSVSLSKNSMDPARLYGHGGYINDYSARGATWVSANTNFSGSKLYADLSSQIYVLTISGLIYWGNVNVLTNSTIIGSGNSSIVYLNTLNFVHGTLYGSTISNVRDLAFLEKMNAVNDNGGCKVFQLG